MISIYIYMFKEQLSVCLSGDCQWRPTVYFILRVERLRSVLGKRGKPGRLYRRDLNRRSFFSTIEISSERNLTIFESSFFAKNALIVDFFFTIVLS